MADPRAGSEPQTLWYVQAVERVWGPFPQARLSRFVTERRLTTASLVASQPDGPFGPAGGRSELAALFEPGDPFKASSPVQRAERDSDVGAPEPFPPKPFTPVSESTHADGAAVADLNEPASPRTKPPSPRGELVTLRPRRTAVGDGASAIASVAPAQPLLPRRTESRPAELLQAEPSAAQVAPPAHDLGVAPEAAPRRDPPAARSASPSRALLVAADLSSLSSVAFEAALAEQGRFAGVRLDMWLVRTPLDATTLRNRLSRRLSAEDTLLVVDAPLDHAAWFNLDPEAEWNLRQLWSA